MSERKNPETSNEAYRSLKVSELNETYRLILSALSVLGEGTFEDISAYLKVDKSRIWKRMSELERMQLVYRPGNKRLLKSGRNGFTWCLTSNSLPKTEEGNPYKKGTKAATDFAGEILANSKKTQVTQPTLF